ncbi:hypothetical protein O181_026482 [Austropuccinia psidii MF-1]|uniref:MATH domain-containing protein n=1 Tax=Austropuccinia psidii MF-1 TaxID=1389203 RepID=A0A9Q3CQN6_9BASI|nr:hypothetical protein [Austropuccinia psidii MF-1]
MNQGSNQSQNNATSNKQANLNTTNEQEFLEIKSVSLEWKLSNLKQIFDSSKGDIKSKCVKSSFFGESKWQVFFYPNSGHDQYCSLYLSCQPTQEEFEKATITQLTNHYHQSALLNDNSSLAAASNSNQPNLPNPNGQAVKPIDPNQVPWHRDGLFKFTFEIKSLDRRTTYKTMEANDHAFNHEARNWGWAQYWRRNEAYYMNPSAKFNDAFLICCTIVYSPTPPAPQPTSQIIKKPIPLDLLEAYSSLFNDPLYSDICFKIIRRIRRPDPNRKSRIIVRKLYASKKILIKRSEYFSTMFESGFAESTAVVTGDLSDELNQQRDFGSTDRFGSDDDGEDEDDLMDEDSDDGDDGEEEVLGPKPADESFENKSTGRDKIAQLDVAADGTINIMSSDEMVDDSIVPVDYVKLGDEHLNPVQQPVLSPTLVHEVSKPTDEIKTGRVGAMVNHKNANQSTPSRPSQDLRLSLKTVGSNCCTDPPASNNNLKTPLAKSRAKSGGSSLSRKMTVIEVTDAAFTTFKALLFFLYTDSISFAPLSSTYRCLKDEAMESSVPFYATRHEYLTAMMTKVAMIGTGGQMGGSPPDVSLVCSAKAIYRLADKLNLVDLKARAYHHITKSLTVQNIPMEVFSTFTSAFEEIRKVEVSFMLTNWNEIRDSRSMRKVLAMMSEGGKVCPGFGEVWSVLLRNLEYKPKKDNGIIDEQCYVEEYRPSGSNNVMNLQINDADGLIGGSSNPEGGN